MKTVLPRQKNKHRTLCTLFVLFGFLALSVDPAFGVGHQISSETLSIWEAVIFGIVEGLTEFLPISSTGHLLATKEILNVGQTELTETAIDSYIVSIQIVAFLYRQRLMQMILGIRGKSAEGKQMLSSLIAAFIPTAVIGLAAADFVKDKLYALWPVAVAWIAGGSCILVVERRDAISASGKKLEELTPQRALLIGLVQALALWPGVSRSLVTILAALFVGLTLKAAVEFSFLLGFITLSAATIFELGTDGQTVIDSFGYATPLIGLCVAFIAAVLSVRFMVDWLEKKSFAVFGYYRIAVGIIAATLLSAGYF